MKKKIAIAIAAAIAIVVPVLVLVQPASAATGIRVANGRILEANGNDFIMRGVSHAHTWYTGQTSSFANIKARGANTVRVVLSGQRTPNSPTDVANVIRLCKASRLICILENHDTTGLGDTDAVTLDTAANYWISLKSVLTGQENYVIINIGNEPIGNNGVANWTSSTQNAIRKLRSNGFEHAIMVDGPNWGQDWSFTMRDNAPAVAAADPLRNTIFSIHMYGVYNTAAEVTAYIDSFVNRGLPIIVGEFGHNHSDGDPDENTIMSHAQTRRIGYIGWSWSGNGGGVEYLDMVNGFNANSLTSWGERIFNGANGIRATSREATIYSGGQPGPGPTSSSPRPPTPSASPTGGQQPPPPPGGCTATYAVTGQWQGGFQGDVRVTAGSGGTNGWTVTWTFANGQGIQSSWNTQISSSGSTVTARNVGHNGRLSAGQVGSFGFIGSWSGSNPVPTVSCSAS
ncbi:MAG TPA: cellulase family glycosylhydrolase [Pilimelia sp.]|nr:cellulase family glycosylhydrolase [Pilimelia sp.]